jgi:GNAT superfamily N-acetyltransferase
MTPDRLTAAMEATWPAAATTRLGPWLLRDGQGGGKRVSATSLLGDFDKAALTMVEVVMRDRSGSALFTLGPADAVLDAALAELGYKTVDPVVIYAARLTDLPQEPAPHMTTFPHWPPLGIAVDLWAEGGIDAARLAVMHRVAGPKCAILGRQNDRAAGVAFVAAHGPFAFVHALEISPLLRRKGVARHILQAAVSWANEQGATELALAVTSANDGARALYASFGMQVVGQYHYRQR